MPDMILPPPSEGYDGDSFGPGTFLSGSRNFSLERSLPVTRRGYVIRRVVANVSTVGYLERFPVDSMDAVHGAAYMRGAILYRDAVTPFSLDNLTVDPYGATGNAIPQWAHAYGRTVLVNGNDFRVLIRSGGVVVSKSPMADPGVPTLAAVGGGSMTQGVAWYVRVRWYDSSTGTFSGPSERTTAPATATITLGGGNSSIQVTQPTPPSRATHWQVQMVQTTDTPSGYQINTEGYSSGLIGIGTTSVTFTVNPTSGTRFEFRDDGANVYYRHSNPPDAHFVVFFRGRWFYASAAAGWLVWTDVGNPEHFFHDTDDPNFGFGTSLGDGVGNSIGGPCTALFSNQFALFYATRTDIHMGEGSWQEVFNEDGTFAGRRARISPLTQGGLGASCASSAVVDQDIYFLSALGPALISGGRAYALRPASIRNVWAGADRRHLNRTKVVYDPDTDTVMFSLVTQQSPSAGAPDMILPWQRSREVWAPPWNLLTSGGALQRVVLDDGTERGARAVFGTWHGQAIEFGVGDGDGWDGSHADAAERTPTSVTTTSATFSGETWALDEHQGKSVVLVDPEGNWHYRQVSTNNSTVLNWVGAVSGFATTWKVVLGGIPAIWHFGAMDADSGQELAVRSIRIPLDDQPSRRGA